MPVSRRKRGAATETLSVNKENVASTNKQPPPVTRRQKQTPTPVAELPTSTTTTTHLNTDFMAASSTGDLKKCLKNLAGKLSELEQDALEVCGTKERKVLATNAQNLLTLIDHRDKSIRILAACSISDVLRLYVPEPPYDEADLTRVFMFLVNELGGIRHTGPTAKDFVRYFYLLQSVAEVKFFLLCPELDDGVDIAVALMKTLFASVCDEHAHQVVSYAVSIMESLLEEFGTDDVPVRLVEPILFWLAKDSSTEDENRPRPCQVARSVVVKSSEVFKKHFGNFVEQEIVGGGRDRGTPGADDVDVSSFTFQLIEKMAEICPEVLDNTYALLLQNLRVDNDEERLQMATVVCKIMAKNHSHIIADQPQVWRGLLSRFRDPESRIRAVIAEHSKYFLYYHHEHCSELIPYVEDALTDVDDEVRLNAVVAVVDTCMQNENIVPTSLLEAVRDRCKDKRHAVRRVAVEKLSALYAKTMARFGEEAWPGAALKKYGWIPEQVLRLWYLVGRSDSQTKLAVEKILDQVLTAPDPGLKSSANQPKSKAARLLFVIDHLELTSSVQIFYKVVEEQAVLRNYVLQMCDIQLLCKNATSDKIALKDMLLAKISQCLPDPPKTLTYLKHFDKIKDLKVHRLLAKIFHSGTPPENVQKLGVELASKIGKKNMGVVTAVTNLIRRGAPSWCRETVFTELLHGVVALAETVPDYGDASVNRDAVESRDRSVVRGCQLLLHVAVHFASVVAAAPVMHEVVALLDSSHEAVRDVGLQLLPVIGEVLNTTAPDLTQNLEARFKQAWAGCDPTLAKLVTRASFGLSSEASRVKMMEDVVANVVKALPSATPGSDATATCVNVDKSMRMVTLLTVLREVAILAPAALDAHEDYLMYTLLLNGIFKEDIEEGGGGDDDGDDVGDLRDTTLQWAPHALCRQARVLVAGLKLLGALALAGAQRRAGGVARASSHERTAHGRAVMAQLFEVLDLMGACCERQNTEKLVEADRALLRLVAFKTVLKMVTSPEFEGHMTPDRLQLLGTVIQDPTFEVRCLASTALLQALQCSAKSHYVNCNVQDYYMSLFALASIDPEQENIDKASDAIKLLVAQRRKRITQATQGSSGGGTTTTTTTTTNNNNNNNNMVYIEYTLPHLLHMLSHHEDFDSMKKIETVQIMEGYLYFYLDRLVANNNYTILYQMAEAMKNVEDLHAESSKKIYCLCDLVIAYIFKKTQKKNYMASNASIRLPVKLFRVARKPGRNVTNWLPMGYEGSALPKPKASATPRKKRPTPVKKQHEKDKAKKRPSPKEERGTGPSRRNAGRRAKKANTSYNDDDGFDTDEDLSPHSKRRRQ